MEVGGEGPRSPSPPFRGLGKVLRLLRAARIVAPRDPLGLVGRADHAAELLGRAVGTTVRLEVRPRTRLRFLAWTERGVETVHDVEEVIEEPDAWVVRRMRGRFPVRFERSAVIRQRIESERWHEIFDIERA
jgi:hypothetical protein